MEYRSVNQYLRETFGCKVYKVPLNAGLTCPNRDGTLGTRGCIFCSAGGSGEFAANVRPSADDFQETMNRQMELAREKLAHKNRDGKYMAYFQAFTNTYGPIDYLEKVFLAAIRVPDVVGISIATRPDCLGDDVLELLDRLNRIKPVWVELGLQTIHEDTARYVRRGYPLSTFDEAVRRLRDIHVETIVHVILGLPGETVEDMLQTVDYVCKSNVQGIKLQLLHVLRGTDLATDYLAGKFQTFTLEEYVDVILRCLAIIPQDVVIHRLTGEGHRDLLIAPEWSLHRKVTLNTLNKAIAQCTTNRPAPRSHPRMSH